MKKLVAGLLSVTTVLTLLTGCGTSTSAKAGNDSNPITVVSREEGSGTRGAFVELFKVEEKDANDKKVDHTTQEAEITNSTSVMMTSISGNPDAIGYISLGSLNDTVKAAKIDGAEASVENIKSGSYKISRPFNIATKEGVSEVGKDFIAFILSKEGQTVVEQKGYITVADKAAAYAGTKPAGKIVVAGSSSVSPVMESLKEAYLKVNEAAAIEIQQSDSTTGMTSAKDGICDIGMASRELKDSEKSAGLSATQIALDGIAVIINKDNSRTDLTTEQVKAIYTGETTMWADVK